MNPPSPSPSQEPGQDISLLLSPTKARQAALESASWKHVTDRLTALFSPSPVPRFEHNDATLKALLELVKVNEDADEERRLCHEARVEALGNASRNGEGGGGLGGNLLQRFEQGLSKEGKEGLDDLAASAVLLSSSGNVSEMETRITDLTIETFDASNDLLTLQQTQQRFERESKAIEQKIASFKAEMEDIDTEAMNNQTSMLNRETKVVGMKLAEYQERIRVLERYDVGPLGIEDIVKREGMVEERRQELAKLERKILAMHGLPPDLDVSRKEVERARNELEEWKRRRDQEFEGLVE
jgi:HAUS augmin-like complex subunit 1